MGELPPLEPNRLAGRDIFMLSIDVTGEESGTRGALPPENPRNPISRRSRFVPYVRRKKLDAAVPSLGDEGTV